MAIIGTLEIVFPGRDDKAKEKSSYAIPVQFKDDDGVLQAPIAIAWGLSTAANTPVNRRSNIQVASPGAETTIVLDPADLDISEGTKRYLTITAKYNSGDLGDGLYVTGEEQFSITDLVGDIPVIQDGTTVIELTDDTILTDETELADA